MIGKLLKKGKQFDANHVLIYEGFIADLNMETLRKNDSALKSRILKNML